MQLFLDSSRDHSFQVVSHTFLLSSFFFPLPLPLSQQSSPFTPPFLSYLSSPSKNIPKERQLLSRRLECRERNCNDAPLSLAWVMNVILSRYYSTFASIVSRNTTKIIRSRWNRLSGRHVDTRMIFLSFRGNPPLLYIRGQKSPKVAFLSPWKISLLFARFSAFR